jgi:hypothetical protein
MIRLAVIITLTPSLALAQPLPQPSQPALAARARTDTRRRDRVRCRFRTGDFVVSRGVEMGVVYFTPMRLARHGVRRRVTRNFAALRGLPWDANLPTG